MGVNIYYLKLIYEKGHTDRNLIFEKKRLKALEKKILQFIRINTNKKGYDTDYDASRIQLFICKIKDRKLKKLNKKLK